MRDNSLFARFARWTARAAGRPASFAAAVAVVVLWLATGPLFHFSDTWQLVINTGTTIVTFLMVFLIQSTQNRDARRSRSSWTSLSAPSRAPTTLCWT